MRIKSIRNLKSLRGKTVFLRADLNAPIKGRIIKDDYKIVAILPTIRFLLRHNCRLIIATHLADGKATTKPIAKRLASLLDKKIKFAGDYNSGRLAKLREKMKAKDIIFLENLRFNSGEEKNDSHFAKELAKLADLYVNDAFAVCHRNHASMSAIKRYLPSYAGLLLEKEILNLEKILRPNQPLISIIGGAKIETKIALLNNLAKKSYRVLIGGALANNFIAAHGFKIGKSLADKASIKIAAGLIKKYKNIILPVDVIVAEKVNSDHAVFKPVNQVKKSEIILDIGPGTVKLFAHFLKTSQTIIWNGPLGYFENEHFKHGTMSIARLVATRSSGHAFGAVGGGETIQALKMTGMEHYIDWISTGGGAMLAFLGGEPMPGLRGIVK
ncbi:MAG: phosphoglycerate kinase [Patescibacteria group bacterium]|nr:phosphoglycerate kinase [Patescibacteria group bacterium]